MSISLFLSLMLAGGLFSERTNVPLSPPDAACQLYLPNAFSPNGDGKNDLFKVNVGSNCTINAFNLRVYDRWGNQVFESQSVETAWDGTHKGELVKADLYLFHLQYSVVADTSAVPITQTGELYIVK
jgi:gliding motility-associated-like protein